MVRSGQADYMTRLDDGSAECRLRPIPSTSHRDQPFERSSDMAFLARVPPVSWAFGVP